ncbi:hypothetical protein GGX14DRAFT_393045 [Mycena pura]|uniref:Uncharacterized protein n=1 Tax=Mycena pura TaxID=153505 RepID=A0AAD6VI11_9AGAR|nr:hypothetical protein GGX14DRAFT_393045 [Mycena pura]
MKALNRINLLLAGFEPATSRGGGARGFEGGSGTGVSRGQQQRASNAKPCAPGSVRGQWRSAGALEGSGAARWRGGAAAAVESKTTCSPCTGGGAAARRGALESGGAGVSTGRRRRASNRKPRAPASLASVCGRAAHTPGAENEPASVRGPAALAQGVENERNRARSRKRARATVRRGALEGGGAGALEGSRRRRVRRQKHGAAAEAWCGGVAGGGGGETARAPASVHGRRCGAARWMAAACAAAEARCGGGSAVRQRKRGAAVLQAAAAAAKLRALPRACTGDGAARRVGWRRRVQQWQRGAAALQAAAAAAKPRALPRAWNEVAAQTKHSRKTAEFQVAWRTRQKGERWTLNREAVAIAKTHLPELMHRLGVKQGSSSPDNPVSFHSGRNWPVGACGKRDGGGGVQRVRGWRADGGRAGGGVFELARNEFGRIVDAQESDRISQELLNRSAKLLEAFERF